METIRVKYNPNQPYVMDTSNIEYEVTAKPVFSGCMKQKGKYVAYTQQGTILHDVSQSDCMKLINEGDRPFNYFAKEEQQLQQRPQLQQPQQTVNYDPEFIAKYQAAKAQGLI